MIAEDATIKNRITAGDAVVLLLQESEGGGSTPVDISLNSELMIEGATTDQDINVHDSEGADVGTKSGSDFVIGNSTVTVQYENETLIENVSVVAEGSAIVKVPNPIATLSVDFSADATEIDPDTEVTFTATGDVGVGFYHVWDFGDGNIDVVEDSATVAHTYTTEETVTVGLFVIRKSDDAAGSEEKADYIVIESQYTPYIGELTASPFFSFGMYKPGADVTNGITIREDSGDVETDIAYTASGLINTSAITTALSGANGFLVTAFNGDNSGDDATESSAGAQAQYNSSGALGKPCFEFDNSNSESYMFSSAFPNSGPFHAFALIVITGNAGADLVLSVDSGNGAWGYMRYRP